MKPILLAIILCSSGLAQTSLEDSAAGGESVYQANCLACHQANGEGVPSAFPPLDAHAATLASVAGGPILATCCYTDWLAKSRLTDTPTTTS